MSLPRGKHGESAVLKMAARRKAEATLQILIPAFVAFEARADHMLDWGLQCSWVEAEIGVQCMPYFCIRLSGLEMIVK